jgi:hypothetical protein
LEAVRAGSSSLSRFKPVQAGLSSSNWLILFAGLPVDQLIIFFIVINFFINFELIVLFLFLSSGRVERTNENGVSLFGLIDLGTCLTFLFSLLFRDDLLNFEIGERTASWTR